MNIREWLAALELGQYADAFEDNAIDADTLPHLDHDLLQQVGVKAVGHRVRILKAIAGLDEQPTAQAPGEAGTGTTRDAERRQLTIMFADLVGSTELSQRLDAEELRRITLRYQDAAKAAIERFGGFVARYMGDGVLAYFGYPQAHEDDAARALRAGLTLVDAIRALEPGGLEVRVGVATGPVIVGDLIGEGASQESAVVGETPNLAARLQGVARAGRVVASQATARLVDGAFDVRDLGATELKGFSTAHVVYEVVAERAGVTRFEAQQRGRKTPLVGRDSELALLDDRWERARDGEGQVVLVSGEPGIGKSRLTEHFISAHDGHEFIHMVFQCSPHHASSPFQAVVGGLDRVLNFEEGDDNAARQAKVERWVASVDTGNKVLAELTLALMDVDSGQPSRFSRREQYIQFLVTLVSSPVRPILLLFEDMHWADPTTLDAASALVEASANDRVLVLMTTRPGFEPPWQRVDHATILSLNRLGRRHRSAMIETLLGEASLSGELVERIAEQTDGIPLFVEELTRTLIEAGTEVGTSSIPETLHDSLLERLDRLGAAKSVAQAAAVIGREFERDLLLSASAESGADVDAALAALEQADLAFRRRDASGATTYVFKHALIRDAAYATLLTEAREAVHRRIAERMEDDGNARHGADQMAYHREQAGDFQRSAELWLQASSAMFQRGALLELLNLTASGLRVLEHLPKTPERDRMEMDFQEIRSHAGRFTGGNADPVFGASAGRALTLAAKHGDPRIVRVLFSLGMYHWGCMDILSMRKVAEEARRHFDASEFGHVAWMHSLASAERTWSGQLREARPHLEKIGAFFDEHKHLYGGRPLSRGMFTICAVACGRGYLHGGQYDKAEHYSRGVLELVQDNSDQHNTIPFLAERLTMSSALWQFDEARSAATLLVERATRARHPAYVLMGQRGLNFVDAPNNPDAAERAVDEALGSEAQYTPDVLPYSQTIVSQLMAAGLWTSLDRYVERFLPEMERRDWFPVLLPLSLAKSIRTGMTSPASSTQFADACATLEANIARCMAGEARYFALLTAIWYARLLQHHDRPRAAYAALEPVYASHTEGFDVPIMREARRLLDALEA